MFMNAFASVDYFIQLFTGRNSLLAYWEHFKVIPQLKRGMWCTMERV